MSNYKFKIIVFASVLASFVAGAFACDTWGYGAYYEMMEALSLGKQGEAYSMLKNRHCEDTLAWRMANNLMTGKEDPVDVFRWIVQDGCRTKWVYADIPIYYVRYNKYKYEGKKIIHESFSDVFDKSDCPHDERFAIEIDFDAVGTYFYCLNTYEIDFRQVVVCPID